MEFTDNRIPPISVCVLADTRRSTKGPLPAHSAVTFDRMDYRVGPGCYYQVGTTAAIEHRDIAASYNGVIIPELSLFNEWFGVAGVLAG